MPLKSTAVAQRAEAAGAIDPGLIAAVNTLPTGRIELGILDVEHADNLLIDIDKLQIVELLQHHMARIEQHPAARMMADVLMKHFECHTVVQILARVNFVTQVDPCSSQALSTGSQRTASSSNAVSISPSGRCGNGNR